MSGGTPTLLHVAQPLSIILHRMKTTTLMVLMLGGFLLAGCGTPYQGIRFRVQYPNIDEGFRKMSLAASVDGYPMDAVDPLGRQFETGWKELKEEELSKEDRILPPASVQGKLVLRLETRGKLYDIFLTPSLRYARGEQGWEERIAPVAHPLRTKWERVAGTLLERESKEED